MNQKEQKRLLVLNQVGEGRLVGRLAAMALGVSLRHTRRLLARYRKEGAQALAHGNRCRKPANTTDPGLCKKVADLAMTRYAGCNTQHFTELMAEREGIMLNRSTVRRMLRASGVPCSRKRRPPRHRSRRDRFSREGQIAAARR